MSDATPDPIDIIAGNPCPFCGHMQWNDGEVSMFPILAARDVDRTPSANVNSVIRVAVFTCQNCRYVATFSLEPLLEEDDPLLSEGE